MKMNASEKDFFHQATLQICSSLEIEKALHRCFTYVRKYIPADKFGLSIIDREFGGIRSIVRANEEGGEFSDVLVPLSPEARAEVASEENNREVRIFNWPNLSLPGRELVQYCELPETSFLLMHLVLECGTVGALTVTAHGREQYTPEHARLLSMLRDPFAIAMSNALKHREIRKLTERVSEENRSLYRELMQVPGNEIIGAEFGLKSVMNMVENVAPVDSPVLLLGETGAGKDVIANAIHRISDRNRGPIVKVNCGAIPESIMDSELFGHEKGAFTGAAGLKRGRFERADGGTIFLDEIGELSPEAQVRLLRVLQHKEIERVGGTQAIRLNIRIIAATHRNLAKMVADGAFREDLWFRLNVFPIEIPPLRNRRADIPGLVHYFVAHKARELKRYPPPGLAPGAIDQLTSYAWPGNVRELENIIERALILNRNSHLKFDHLASPGPGPGPGPSQPAIAAARETEVFPTLDEALRRHVQAALRKTDGRIEGPKGAARLLGINPSTLRSRMIKFGISSGKRSRQRVRKSA